MELNIHEMARQIAEEALDNITYHGKTIREWADQIETLEEERAALIAALRKLDIDCDMCAHRKSIYDTACAEADCECLVCKSRTCACKDCIDNSKWMWRGVQPGANPRQPDEERCLATGGLCSMCTPGPCDHRRTVIHVDSGQ